MDFSFIKEDDLKKRFAKITIKNAYIKHLDIDDVGHKVWNTFYKELLKLYAEKLQKIDKFKVVR